MTSTTKVFLPQMVEPKIEGQIELFRNMLMDEYTDFKKELIKKREKEGKKDAKDTNQEEDNFSNSEKAGLKKLKKRIKSGELVVVKTDKSGKLGVISRAKYLEM